MLSPPPVPAINHDGPPEGTRLELGVIAAARHVTITQMEEATRLSRGAVHAIVSNNVWPKRLSAAERQAVKDRLTHLLREAGATPQELADLFKAHVRRRADRPRTQTRETAPTPASEQHHLKQEIAQMLLAKQSLTTAARKQFALFTNPFSGEVQSDAELFLTPDMRFVREAMWQTAIHGGFGAVVGESGAGKTTLLADLEERIAREHHQVTMVKLSVLTMFDGTGRDAKAHKGADIIAAVILELTPGATLRASVEARTRQMVTAVTESFKVGNRHLLLIEEAHSLSVPTLQHLKRLHEKLRVGRMPAMGILLLGQPELRNKLNDRRHEVREVVQRCEMVDLPPLDADLRAYLEHRAALVDKRLAELIDEDAVDTVRQRLTVISRDTRRKEAVVSLCYPLAVNNFMTAALNVAADLGAPRITRDVVMAV